MKCLGGMPVSFCHCHVLYFAPDWEALQDSVSAGSGQPPVLPTHAFRYPFVLQRHHQSRWLACVRVYGLRSAFLVSDVGKGLVHCTAGSSWALGTEEQAEEQALARMYFYRGYQIPQQTRRRLRLPKYLRSRAVRGTGYEKAQAIYFG